LLAAAAAGGDDDDERVDNRMNVLTLRLRFIHNALLWLPSADRRCGPGGRDVHLIETCQRRLVERNVETSCRVFSGALHKILSS
jgi:hypothetical protein